MKKTEVMAQILFAFSKLPESVKNDEECKAAFKYVIEMLKKQEEVEI